MDRDFEDLARLLSCTNKNGFFPKAYICLLLYQSFGIFFLSSLKSLKIELKSWNGKLKLDLHMKCN